MFDGPEIAARGFRQHHAYRNLAIRQREFGRVHIDFTDGGDADRLA